MPARKTRPRLPGVPGASPFSSPVGLGRIYGLVLLLLTVVFFMLMYRGRVPRAVERAWAPAVVEPEVLEARQQELATQLGGAWLDPKDGADFEQTEGYRHLLGFLVDHAHELPAEPPHFDRELAMRSPDMQRGKLVKLRGLVNYHRAAKLETKVWQLTDVWRTFMTDGDAEDGLVVDVIEPPPELEQRRDVVEMDAYFYRLVSYEGKKGKLVTIPYLLARSLKVVPEEPRSLGAGLSDPANIVLLIALLAMVAWAVFRFVNMRRKRPVVRLRAPHLHSSAVPQPPEG